MGKLNGKVALVTGGNSGIGLASAKLFREEGATVVVTASSPASYERAVQELGKQFDVVQADVSKLAELDRLYAHVKAKHGGIDVLFANAGLGKFVPSIETDEALYDQLMNVNLKGLYFTVTKALPLLKPGSSVILTGSSVSIKGMAGASVYAASKAGVRSLARTWTAEIPAATARFNVLSPGPTETPIFHKSGFTAEQRDAFEQQVIGMVPARRMAQADEIARAALFLASSDSSYVYGADLFADGGISQV